MQVHPEVLHVIRQLITQKDKSMRSSEGDRGHCYKPLWQKVGESAEYDDTENESGEKIFHLPHMCRIAIEWDNLHSMFQSVFMLFLFFLFVSNFARTYVNIFSCAGKQGLSLNSNFVSFRLSFVLILVMFLGNWSFKFGNRISIFGPWIYRVVY